MTLADDHGGADALDESTRVLIRQAAGLTVEAENLQRRIARGEPVNHEDLVRVARVLNQLMRQLGLKKAKPKGEESPLAAHFSRPVQRSAAP
jgi:hypothetical protein